MNSAHDSMITVQELTKEYGTQTALDTISFHVRKGEVFGFLGPNGAGKTTTIKAILGLIRYKQGIITIQDVDIVKQGKLAREVVGYLPERVALYANLTAIQNLQFFADLKKVTDIDFEGLLREYGLADVGKKKIREFSKGMVQRLGMAQATLGSPQLLILDEPSGGLDPRGVRLIREKIRTAKKKGTTVFLSSHILSEVQAVCDRIGIIHKGKIVAEDSVSVLGKKLDLKPRITVQLEAITPAIKDAVYAVKNLTTIEISGNIIEVVCNAEQKAHVILAIANAGGNIINLQTEEPSLEEVFIRYTEE